MMRDLKAGGALLGLLGSAYFYPYAAMQLPAGLLSDSWGPRRTITLFLGIAVVGSLLMGLAKSVVWVILGRTLVGLGVSMLFVSTLKVLAEWFHRGEFSMMTGILMGLGGVGSLTAQAPLAMLSSWIGWRVSFVVVAIFTILLAILVWAFVRDRPAGGTQSHAPNAKSEDDYQIGLREGVRRVLSSAGFWPIAIWFFFTCGIFFSFGGLWGGPYLMHIYGMSKEESGRILSMLAVAMIIGSPMVSFLSNRIVKGRKPVLLGSSLLLVCLTGFLAFLTDGLSPPSLYAICFGLGISSSAIVVIAFTSTKELFPVQIAGTATGLVNLFPFSGGAAFQPLLGYLLERQGKTGEAFKLIGYEQAFLVLFVAAVIALLASLFMRETLPTSSKSTRFLACHTQEVQR
jgi:MFS family permease